MEYKNWQKRWMFRAENAGYPICVCAIMLVTFPGILTLLSFAGTFGFMLYFGLIGYSEII